MFQNIVYKCKMFFYTNILKRDTMEFYIQSFRDRGVKIGSNMRAFSPPLSAEPFLLEFGNNITISSGVKFTTHDNSAAKVFKGSTNSLDLFGRIIIGNNCFIGQNALILPGVVLANNTIVAAGSVVTKSFTEDGKIIGGNPAKIIGDIESYRKKYANNVLNTDGKNKEEKRKYLLENENLFVIK